MKAVTDNGISSETLDFVCQYIEPKLLHLHSYVDIITVLTTTYVCFQHNSIILHTKSVKFGL